MTNYKLNRFGFYNYFNYRNQTFDANTQSIVFNGEKRVREDRDMLSLFPTIFLGSMRVVDNKRSLDYYIKAGEAGFAWVEFKADDLLQTLLLAYSKSADGIQHQPLLLRFKARRQRRCPPLLDKLARIPGSRQALR